MKHIIFIITLLFAANAIFAEDTGATPPARDSYYQSGYFVGLNLGEGRSQIDSVAGLNKKDKGLFGHVNFGYDLNHYFAFQLGYLYLPTAKYTQVGMPDVNVKTSGYDGLLKAMYPVGEGFAVYGDVGGAILSTSEEQEGAGKISQNATVLAYGGGIDYVFANIGGLHLVADYYHTNKKATKTLTVPAQDAVSLGIYYQF